MFQPLLHGHNRLYFWNPGPAALFGGADGNLLPVPKAFVFPVAFEFDVAAFGGQRHDFAHAHFHCFLYGVVHAVALGQGLCQYYSEGRFCFVFSGFLDFHLHVLFSGFGNGGVVVLAVTVEELKCLACLHAQDPAHMVGGVVVQLALAADSQGAVGEDARDSHGGGSQSLTAISMPSVAT